MADPVAFSFSGNPRGKGRPRVSAKGRFAKIYTDSLTREYEASVKDLTKKAMGNLPPMTGALSVSLRFRLAVPKSTAKYLTALYLSGERAYLGSIDCDNMAKSILDGMNAVAYVDDVQITRLFISKVAAAKPGVDIRIEPLAPQEYEL